MRSSLSSFKCKICNDHNVNDGLILSRDGDVLCYECTKKYKALYLEWWKEWERSRRDEPAIGFDEYWITRIRDMILRKHKEQMLKAYVPKPILDGEEKNGE